MHENSLVVPRKVLLVCWGLNKKTLKFLFKYDLSSGNLDIVNFDSIYLFFFSCSMFRGGKIKFLAFILNISVLIL